MLPQLRDDLNFSRSQCNKLLDEISALAHRAAELEAKLQESNSALDKTTKAAATAAENQKSELELERKARTEAEAATEKAAADKQLLAKELNGNIASSQ